jgi:hypothetical protein
VVLAAVGHTAVDVADSSDVVLVGAPVVVVVDVVEGLLLQPIATIGSADSSAATTTRRVIMIQVSSRTPCLARVESPGGELLPSWGLGKCSLGVLKRVNSGR